MNIKDPESLVQCPYDKVHMIRLKRLPYHLQKCRRNYRGQEYSVCPFNARHEVPAPEYQHHITHCSDKFIVEKDMVHIKRLQEDEKYRKICNGDKPTMEPDELDSVSRNQLGMQESNSLHFLTTAPEEDALGPAQISRLQKLRQKRMVQNDDHKQKSEDISDWQDTKPSYQKPKTLPVALQMMSTFGRGDNSSMRGQSPTCLSSIQESNAIYGIGRGTYTSTALKKITNLKPGYDNDSPFIKSSEQLEQEAQYMEIPEKSKFPSWQKKATPRYNSSFAANRTPSRQAQLQIAQAQGECQPPSQSKQTMAIGRGFSRHPQSFQDEVDRGPKNFGRGRGIVFWN